MAAVKRSKNQIRRERLKLRKQNDHDDSTKDKVAEGSIQLPILSSEADPKGDDGETGVDTDVYDATMPKVNAITAAVEEPDTDEASEVLDDPLREHFASVFTRFQDPADDPKNEDIPDALVYTNLSNSDLESASSDEESHEDEQPLSKRQWRIQNKVSLAALKLATKAPNIVEWCDADAPDPFFLVQLKSQPNVVPVPSHWSAKRDYLSSRRGYEKPPFELPKFIRDTGIQEMRSGVDDQTLRQLQRDRVQPKMGRLDIDYQKLHDAFFKHQAPPLLLGFGHVYFEGRELGDVNETLIANIKPGVLSAPLRAALGMPEHDTRVPPPWIQVMQQEGKSPGYRNMMIPGVDEEYNNDGYYDKNLVNKNIGHTDHWGQLQELDEEDEEDEDEDRDNEMVDDEKTDIIDQEQGDDVETITDSAKIPITEFGGSTHTTTMTRETIDSDLPLYTVIGESSSTSGRRGLMADKLAYDIDQANTSPSDKTNPVSTERPKLLEFKF